MSIKLDVTKRIEWLKKRMTITEQDEGYIRLQMMEAMMEALEKGQTLPIDSVVVPKGTLCDCKYPLVRTGSDNSEYCGFCLKDL